MKKKTIIIIASVVLTLAILAGGALVYYINSPVRALKLMHDDLEKNGIDGLHSHFTSDAAELYDALMDASDNWLVKTVLERAGLYVYVEAFKEHSEDIRWEFADLLTSSSRADVYLHFEYKGDLKGMLELRLIKEDGEWKIDGFGIPDIEGFDLTACLRNENGERNEG